MSERFEYDRMTDKDFRDGLDAIEMAPDTFARLFGLPGRRVDHWTKGKQDIPKWVPTVLRILSVPGAIPEARKAAAEYIRTDNLRPDRGEYPYLRQEGNDE